MTLLEDLEALISKYRSHAHDTKAQKDVLDAIKAVLDDHESRIATLEGA